MNPGALDRRLVLEPPSETADGAGGVTRDYVTVATVWAQVVPQAMRSDATAASLGALQRFRIVLRRRDDITTQCRLREGDAVYRVNAARERRPPLHRDRRRIARGLRCRRPLPRACVPPCTTH